MSLLSALTSAISKLRTDSTFINGVTGLGGPNDPHATTGLNQAPTILTPTELVNLYRNNGVASRVCRIWAGDTTKKGWYVRDPSADPDPMKDEDRRLMIPSRFRTAILFSCIFGAGYLLIVTDEDVDDTGKLRSGYDPAKPLDPKKLLRIVNLIPMTTLECTASIYETDATNPNYGRPEFWSCTPYPYMENRSVTTHHTRVLYFPGTTLPNRDRSQNRGADQSILQAGYDDLKALAVVNQSVGTYVQRLNRDVFRISGLNAIQSADQAREFNDKMNLIMQIRSMLGMMVLDTADDVVNQTAGIAGFSDLSDHIKDAVCAAYDTPRTVLFGESPGGLNSDGDSQRGSWQSQVEGKQQYAILPAATYLYALIYAQKDGPFRGVAPARFDVVFNPLHSPTTSELALVRKETAEMDKIYIDAGVYTAEQVRRGRFGDRGWQFDLPPLAHAASNTGKAEEVFNLSDKQITMIQTVMLAVNEGKLTEAQARGLLMLAIPDLPPERLESLALAPAIPEQIEASTVATADTAGTAGIATPSPLDPILRREIAAGGTRSGTGPNGPWSVQMPCDYGEIAGTRGLDAEPVDYLLIPEGPRGTAYVAEILLPGDEGEEPTLDEHKVILGCADEEAATNLLSEVYGESVEIGEITTLPEGRLLAWLETAGTPRATSLDGTPPEAVRTAVKQGLLWQKEHGGSKATPATLAWARRLSAGMPISRDRLRSVAAAHRLHAAPAPLVDGEAPTPAHIRHALTGGDAGREWVAALSAAARMDAKGKYEHINFKPPEGARTEAQKGLDWRKEHGRGGTPVGIARARDIARGANMSPDTIGRMRSFFARHEVDKKGKGFTPGDGFPSNGRIAWALWGGDAGKAWADKVWKQMEAADRD